MPYNLCSKFCLDCGVEYKPLSGTQKYCKTCVPASIVRRQKRNARRRYHELVEMELDPTNLSAIKEREDYVRYYLWNTARKRALKRGIEFSIELEDVIVPLLCPIFNVPFIRTTSYAKSIDRIDNSLGYVKGNVQVICKKANSMKNDATPEELLMFADWVYKNYKNN